MTSAIQKTIVEKRDELIQFLDRIELIYYDNEYTDNEENNKIHAQILEDMVDNKKGMELCRDAIGNGYIEEVFLDEKIMGYVAKIDSEYAGFIMFKKPDEDYNELYLSLVATKPKLGIPLGKILISVMEEVAIESDIHTIIADSIEGAIEFYMKNDWEVLDKDDEEDTYLIEKQIREKTPEEIKQDEEDEDSEEDYKVVEVYSGYELDFEEYANNDVIINEDFGEWIDHPSYFQRVVNYTYSFF